MNPNILSIILYGSQARSDNDNASDIDICVLTNDRQLKQVRLDEIAPFAPKSELNKIKIASYRSSFVDLMLEHGSLFLWHLRLEGKVLYGKAFFESKIKRLKQFKNHEDEINYHLEIYQDLKRAWESIKIVNELDLSILFTISRNTCMVLSHYANAPVFGRISCFSTAKKLFPKLPMHLDDYLYLARWKIIYERDFENGQDLPESKTFDNLIINVGKLINYATEKTSQKIVASNKFHTQRI